MKSLGWVKGGIKVVLWEELPLESRGKGIKRDSCMWTGWWSLCFSGHSLCLVTRGCSVFLLNSFTIYFPFKGTVFSVCTYACVCICMHVDISVPVMSTSAFRGTVESEGWLIVWGNWTWRDPGPATRQNHCLRSVIEWFICMYLQKYIFLTYEHSSRSFRVGNRMTWSAFPVSLTD